MYKHYYIGSNCDTITTHYAMLSHMRGRYLAKWCKMWKNMWNAYYLKLLIAWYNLTTFFVCTKHCQNMPKTSWDSFSVSIMYTEDIWIYLNIRQELSEFIWTLSRNLEFEPQQATLTYDPTTSPIAWDPKWTHHIQVAICTYSCSGCSVLSKHTI